MKEADSIGRGDEGQVWICLVELELLYDGYFERLAGHATRALTPLHTFTHLIESLYPETRSIPSLPGVLTLSPPQRHTLNLWVGVHRYISYIADPINAGVKRLLEEGVRPEEAFPDDLFPALKGEALYRDAETRQYRGETRNGRVAELTWSGVRFKKLSEVMKLSDELVRAAEMEEVVEDNNGKAFWHFALICPR